MSLRIRTTITDQPTLASLIVANPSQRSRDRRNRRDQQERRQEISFLMGRLKDHTSTLPSDEELQAFYDQGGKFRIEGQGGIYLDYAIE